MVRLQQAESGVRGTQNSKVGMGTGRGWLLSRWMCCWLVTQLHWSGWLEKALGWSWRPARRLCSPSACPPRHASCSPSLWQRAVACCGCSLCQWALEIQRERPHPSHLFSFDNLTTATAAVAAVDCLSSLSVGRHHCSAEVLAWFNFWSKNKMKHKVWIYSVNTSLRDAEAPSQLRINQHWYRKEIYTSNLIYITEVFSCACHNSFNGPCHGSFPLPHHHFHTEKQDEFVHSFSSLMYWVLVEKNEVYGNRMLSMGRNAVSV